MTRPFRGCTGRWVLGIFWVKAAISAAVAVTLFFITIHVTTSEQGGKSSARLSVSAIK
jgi:hypothetical protein